MPDIENPHFDLPFRFGFSGHAACVEQDSSDDILNCVQAVMRTPIGARLDVPDFGIEDQTLKENGPDAERLVQTLARWEPRAEAILSVSHPDYLDLAYYKVSVGVPGRTED